MIRLAQAASSETGTAYGTPPNQLRTGVTASKPEGNLDGELNVIPFYSGGWQAVFRAKDTAIANRIAELAYQIVANGSKVGYGQQVEGGNISRTGLFDALNNMAKVNPWDIPFPVNCDCSSLVGACVYFSGVYEPALRTMNTTKEPNILAGTGAFVQLTDKTLLESACGCKRGDIYFRYGHTAICMDTDITQETTPAIIANCSACNMRDGSSTDYKVIQVLHPGNIVNVISTASNGWKQIEIGGVYGFVSYKYVTDLPKAITTGNVWQREKAGTDGKQIQVIPYKAICYLTGNTAKVGSTTWYDCIYCGKRGWASGKYVKPTQ